MATEIHFGTSGWRAVMADEFTFANVRRAVTGIARYVVSQKASGARVIVGRDPRFLDRIDERLRLVGSLGARRARRLEPSSLTLVE